MKKYTVLFTITVLLCLLLCGGCTAVLAVSAPRLCWIPLTVLFVLLNGCLLILFRFRSICTGWMHRVAKKVDPTNRSALDNFPLPVAMVSSGGTLLFANKQFQSQITGGQIPILDTPLDEMFQGFVLSELAVNPTIDLAYGERQYTVFISTLRGEHGKQYVLYFTDDTELKVTTAEYEASRPVVLQICIDNLEEATDHLRAGERSRIAGTIEMMLEDWITADGGVLQKSANDRFVAITEHRYLSKMTEDRFSILNRIRQTFSEADGCITMSIGIGEGKTIDEGCRMGMQALDMALSRGGDQVAIKTQNGYDFYGGHSGGVEQRTRVRTRIVADALRELMLSSDRVLIMGHRMSDLDCLGSGVALATVARYFGLPSAVVVDRRATMAEQLITTYERSGREDYFIDPAVAEKGMTKDTLLIIVDTHSENMLESSSLYRKTDRVVVVDHHRRKVDYIDNTLLTYHEANSSSACELIAELLPYLAEESCGRLEAEALLAGITLDTRNFVLRTGVRTFEAAAYLRSKGADTVTVKKLFNESLSIQQTRNALVSSAQLYADTAIAVAKEDMSQQRVAVAQAADDLLSVRGVKASFVVSRIGEDTHISARSYGECNVQLIMEDLGGGGHLTMAATQLPNSSLEDAVAALKKAIDRHLN